MRRIEAFSDAVFAIAVTLLVVELPFDKVGDGELGDALRDHWPNLVAYVVSFLTVGMAWMYHHAIFSQIAEVDRTVAVLNLVILMAIAFIPFPTALMGDYVAQGDDAELATVVFSGAWVLAAAGMTSLWFYARRRPGVLAPDVPPDGIRRLSIIFAAAVPMYIAFTVVAAFSAEAALVLYSLTAVGYLFGADHAALGRRIIE